MKPARLKLIETSLLVISLLVAAAYFAGIPNNPPGFFIDEASIAYNAHTISQSGVDEYGQTFPLYFRAFGEYKSPVYIYALAALFRFTGPGVFVPRLLSAVLGLAAAIFLGLLSYQLTGRRIAGLIGFIAAGLTPWLFEVSRLVFEVALLPGILALFLLTLQRASKRSEWTWPIAATLGGLLGLMVYSYAAGRLLAPLFSLGLVFFLTRRRWRGVLLTWIMFALTLLPLGIFTLLHPGTLGVRYKYVTFVKPGDSKTQIATRFVKNYAGNFSPRSWLIAGDPEPRHHLPGMGSLLAGVVILGLMGILVVLLFRRREAWWQFVLYGFAVSAIPSALTLDHFQTLRLIGLPVFLVVLMVPAFEFLLTGKPASESEASPNEKEFQTRLKRMLLAAFVILIIVQGAIFQWQFHTAPPRVDAFDTYYPQVVEAALAQTERPIYLLDQTPAAYMYAYWYATLHGLDLNNFHRALTEAPPAGAVVISHEWPCLNCEMIFERGQFRVYRQK